MQLWVITGVSRGLGAALAHRVLAPDRHVIGFSRSGNPALKDAAAHRGALYEDVELSLADLDALERRAESLLGALPAQLERAVLINNAGVVEPVASRRALDGAAVERALAVNLGAAIVLTARFLAATTHVAQRQVLNISSGAARRPIVGWTAYCTSKAALDMHARCVNAEQTGQPNAACAVALAPGVIDTDMQARIRDHDTASFPDVQRFRDLHAQGQLASPDVAAARIVNYLDRPDFGALEIDDIRSL